MQSKIPKIIHQLWLGDQAKKPYRMMETWRRRNPTWEYREWSESNLFPLQSHKQYDAIAEWNGKADICRYEILHEYGGFFADADTICFRSLDDFFCENDSFVCYENERTRPGLLATCYMACRPKSLLMKHCIRDVGWIHPSAINKEKAWITVGPQFFTQTVQRYQYTRLKVYPSHYFIPTHYDGSSYSGEGPVYAEHYWGATTDSYGKIGR